MLYREATFQEIANEDLILTDNECLILRIEPFADPQVDFGKSTYIPMQLQTDRGYSKFYAILKYLVCFVNICEHESSELYFLL